VGGGGLSSVTATATAVGVSDGAVQEVVILRIDLGLL
jgi:hypothetical protein